MQKPRAAFSLVELVLVVVILGVMAVISLPRFGHDALDRLATTTITREIASDMRLARSLAVAKADTKPQGYAVRMTGGSPYSGYELVDLTAGTTVSTKTLEAGVSCTGDTEFRFGPLGALSPGSGTTLRVAGQGRQYVLTLIAATGSVTIQEP
jgi:prepilin-type N-terminal cleavage/methylation domain-containing protein